MCSFSTLREKQQQQNNSIFCFTVTLQKKSWHRILSAEIIDNTLTFPLNPYPACSTYTDASSRSHCLLTPVTNSHSSAGDFGAHNTQLHKQSSTLKQTPMKHVTGSLCLAVRLLERYQLLFLCITVSKENAAASHYVHRWLLGMRVRRYS